MRVIAPGGGASAMRPTTATVVTILSQEIGEPRGLVRGEDDPCVVGSPGVDSVGDAAGATGWHHGFTPAERIARRQTAARHGGVLGRFRFPGQLQRPRRDEAVLPVAGREIGRWPVLRELVRGDEFGASLIGLAPQEGRRLGEVARLVEHEERARIDMVEPGRRGEVGGPDLRGVTHREGAGRLRGPLRGDRDGLLVEAGEVGGEPFGESPGGPAQAIADGRRPALREEELRRRQQDRRFQRPDGPLVGRVERAQRVDLVAEELDADRQRQRRREDVDDAATPRRIRRDRRPRPPARSRGRTARAGGRPGGPAIRAGARAARPAGRPGRWCAGGGPGRSRRGRGRGRCARQQEPRRAPRSRRR